MERELVMYVRTAGCPYVSIARSVLKRLEVPCREVNIDRDPAARQRLLDWTGYLSVPTLIAALPGQDLPLSEPTPLPPDRSPRGIDRGALITEPNAEQLADWLLKQGFLSR